MPSYNPGLLSIRFGLLRVRSPLLTESSLFLALLRCFSSRGSPALRHDAGSPHRVSPFGYRPLLRLYTPRDRFSQYTASFIGTRCQDILYVPLVALSV